MRQFQNLTVVYSGTGNASKIKLLQKKIENVSAVNCFSHKFHSTWLTGFFIRLCLKIKHKRCEM